MKHTWARRFEVERNRCGLRWKFIWDTRERLKISGAAWSWREVDSDKAEKAGRYWWWNMFSAIVRRVEF